ncbi:MAG TPA: heavy metal translocating P-type ATPase [bacterium]|nr:heavy metal translocating P-type ATPase [bacterium]
MAQPRPVTEKPVPGAADRRGRSKEQFDRGPVAYLWPGAQPVLCALLLIGGRIVEHAVPGAALALYVLSYLAGGTGSALVAWSALRERRVDVNVLMLLAAMGAAYLGSWTEGAILLFLFSTSNALEFYVMGRTRRAIRSLMALRPAEALVRRDGRETVMPADTLRIGDIIIVRPAERVAADGTVVRGASSVDQSPITGESIPVDVGPGSLVFAGTINQRGSLEVRVTRDPEDTTIARIIALVEEAQAAQAPAQRLIDQFGQIYALGVIAAATLTYVALTGHGTPGTVAFYRAITLLVVASPCAVVISTPATVLSAIANAARHGVLFKGGAHLERLARVETVVFDKTGTLTVGRPAVTDVIPFFAENAASLLATAAALEQRSEHALGDAIVAACLDRGIAPSLPDTFEAVTGRGVRGTVAGTVVRVGSEAFLTDEGVPIPGTARAVLTRLRDEGKTPILVADARLRGVIALADTVRPQAAATVTALRTLGVKRLIVLSGDHARAVGTVAAELGLDDAQGDLLPADKVRAIEVLEEAGPVTMVGDGVNDAPALAAASVGIAMGAAGTDAAMETADVVLMGDDLTRLPYAIGLSRQARRVIAQNLAFAFTVVGVLVTIVLVTGLRLAIGVVGHEGSTVVVVLNGLRLLGYTPTRTRSDRAPVDKRAHPARPRAVAR